MTKMQSKKLEVAETSLVLRVCRPDFTSYGGFTWPSEIGAEVFAYDWHHNKQVDRPREHISSPDCWCEPELDYKDQDTGAEVWVHRGLQ